MGPTRRTRRRVAAIATLIGAVALALFVGVADAAVDEQKVLDFINAEDTDAEKLATASGITGWRAGLIIAYRNAFGKFESLDDVDAVWGVGPSTMTALRESLGQVEETGGGGDEETVIIDDAKVLAFVNDPAVDAARLAEAVQIDMGRANLIIDNRDANGAFASIAEIDAIRGIGRGTLRSLREHLGRVVVGGDGGGDGGDTGGDTGGDGGGDTGGDGGGDGGDTGGDGDTVVKPDVTEDPAQLQQLAFAKAILRYAFDQKFWEWMNYPGMEGHRESTSGWGAGLARARDLRLDGVRYQTWGTSFFNPPAAAYINAKLYPMEKFRSQIVEPGVKVEFPGSSLVVKTLFTEYVAPGMKTVNASVCNSTRSGCINRTTGHLRPGSMHEHEVGLIQVDISTKQYPNWTWATFVFSEDGDPELFNLVPHLQDETYVQTNFDQRYYGPVDNPRSSCIACHQMAQFPPISIGLGISQAGHHTEHPGPFPTARGLGIRVDFIWEVSQALTQYEREHPEDRLELAPPEEEEPETGTQDEDEGEQKLLAFVNDTSLTPESLAEKAGIDVARAKLVLDGRPEGGFTTVQQIDDIRGIGRGTISSLREASTRSSRGLVDELEGIGAGGSGD